LKLLEVSFARRFAFSSLRLCLKVGVGPPMTENEAVNQIIDVAFEKF
jgi:hypothetical protein